MAVPWKWILAPSVLVVLLALLAQNYYSDSEHDKASEPLDDGTLQENQRTSNKRDSSSVYVIGDLHGDVHCARRWVERTGAIDRLTGEWVNPLVALVFVGDYVDKGPTSRQTLEFVKSLTEKYPTQVTALMGNHEMELLLDRDGRRHQVWGGVGYFQMGFSSVHPGEYRNFITSDEAKDENENADQDELVIEALYNASIEVYSRGLHRKIVLSSSAEVQDKSILNFIAPNLKPLVKERMTLYQKHYVDAFRSNTSLGAWLEKRPVLALVQNTLFVHGGVSAGAAKYIAAMGVDGINQLLAQNAKEDKLLDFIKGTEVGAVVYNLLTFRGNHKASACSQLPNLLPAPAKRLGVGHTPGDSVRILCNNQFLAIDSSLGRWFRNSGNNYCPGHKVQIASNGKYGCDKMNDQCEGQIVKIHYHNDKIEIIS
ncbi:hypothetical protein ACA910_002616 [Epithemia clementina (nom. ined.)]